MQKTFGLNEQQWKIIGKAIFGSTGLIAWFLTKKLGLSDEETKMYLDALVVITPVLATVWLAAGQTSSEQVKNVANMPVEEKVKAIANIPPKAFAQIAEALPNEAKVEAILAMPPEATAAAVANLSLQDQANIVASLPDAAVVTAAGAMPGVEVKVGHGASDSAKSAAMDDSVPGVFPV